MREFVPDMMTQTYSDADFAGDGSPLRVLHVAQPTTEGVMVVVRDLLQDQVKRGWDVSIACPENGDLREEAQRRGATWHNWHAMRKPGPSVLAETRRLKAIIAESTPALVHLHSSKAGLAGRLAIRGRLPTVFEPNAWSFHAVSGLMRQAAMRWERFGARWTNATICVSDDERRAAEAAGISNPMVVIRNGVNLEHWPRPLSEDRLAARRVLGLPDDVPIVVAVGRLCRQKGQDLLLQAWPSVIAQHPAAQLVLVGEGDMRASLESMGLPSVRFAGASREVRSWYLIADVVAMPSRWEGLSLALLEAMATERPVVAFNVSGMSDALTEDCGVLVRPESTDDLARALTDLLAAPDRRTALAAAARHRAETVFDIRQTCQRVAELYSQLTK